MSEERRESNEGEKDSDEKNHPLSREGWIMLLSSEINNWMVLFMMVGVLTASSLLVIIGIAVTVLESALFDLFVILALYLCLWFFIGYHWFQKRVKPLKNLRYDLLTGLKDSKEILKRYLDAVGKSDEEKALEKNVKEQKEVLQALQRDMSDLKRRTEEIDFSNLFYVFGSLFVAGGLAMMVATTVATTVVGPVLFFAGVSIISIGALYKWRGLRK